ncbi:hypothetical protein Trydic_g465 [Trypoxylus dichotomus]
MEFHGSSFNDGNRTHTKFTASEETLDAFIQYNCDKRRLLGDANEKRTYVLVYRKYPHSETRDNNHYPEYLVEVE